MSVSSIAPPEPHVLPTPAGRERGYWGEAGDELRRDRAAVIGFALVAVLVLGAIFASLLQPADPNFQSADGLSDAGDPLPPGTDGYLLGTDGLGRDVFSRVLEGARISLFVGIAANLIACLIGMAVGGVAGLAGRRLQAVMMRAVDVIVSFPVLLLAITLLAVIAEPSALAVSVIVGVNFGAYLARLVFVQVVSLRTREYVLAARACGSSGPFVLFRHILPHVLPSAIVYCTLGAATAIQLEAALSYVGLGIRPPQASWGNMIADGQPYLFTAPWLVIVPGVAILLAMVGFSLLGDGLRDALDPTLEKRGIASVAGLR